MGELGDSLSLHEQVNLVLKAGYVEELQANIVKSSVLLEKIKESSGKFWVHEDVISHAEWEVLEEEPEPDWRFLPNILTGAW